MRCTAHGNQFTRTTDHRPQTTHFKSFLLPEANIRCFTNKYISLLSQKHYASLMAIHHPYTIVQCPETQQFFFPRQRFSAGFTLDSFIRGGEWHRPLYLVGYFSDYRQKARLAKCQLLVWVQTGSSKSFQRFDKWQIQADGWHATIPYWSPK